MQNHVLKPTANRWADFVRPCFAKKNCKILQSHSKTRPFPKLPGYPFALA